MLLAIGDIVSQASVALGPVQSGVGLEGGTVPVYVAETVERRLRGNMVSLYQFDIALGEEKNRTLFQPALKDEDFPGWTLFRNRELVLRLSTPIS